MNIIVYSGSASSPSVRRINSFDHWALLCAITLGVVGLSFALGFAAKSWLGGDGDAQKAKPAAVVSAEEVFTHALEQAEAQLSAEATIHNLTQRVAKLQAHVARIDALGHKLVKMAKLSPEEFDFAIDPALGGPEQSSDMLYQIDEVQEAVDGLATALQVREEQLNVLDKVIVNSALEEQTTPSGWPVDAGWISSNYGYRRSPFTGRRQFHKGLDIAGREGSNVRAVAGGVVRFAAKKSAYGYLVEIDHGNGYITRYGHNKSITVEEGQAVKRGAVIALMGSTGRSTGPHVHLEVEKDGKYIDPRQFISTRLPKQ